MFKRKIITVLLIFLDFTFPLFGKPNSIYVLQRPIHTHGCHGMEVSYGIAHKMHGGALGYVYHFNPVWHMKLCGGFTNKNLLTIYNTYHWNLYNHYESTYLNLLVGGQGSYKFDDPFWDNYSKRLNMGIQLGIEVEKYITDYLLLVILAEIPISFLDKDDVFSYRFSGGFRITF